MSECPEGRGFADEVIKKVCDFFGAEIRFICRQGILGSSQYSQQNPIFPGMVRRWDVAGEKSATMAGVRCDCVNLFIPTMEVRRHFALLDTIRYNGGIV